MLAVSINLAGFLPMARTGSLFSDRELSAGNVFKAAIFENASTTVSMITPSSLDLNLTQDNSFSASSSSIANDKNSKDSELTVTSAVLGLSLAGGPDIQTINPAPVLDVQQPDNNQGDQNQQPGMLLSFQEVPAPETTPNSPGSQPDTAANTIFTNELSVEPIIGSKSDQSAESVDTGKTVETPPDQNSGVENVSQTMPQTAPADQGENIQPLPVLSISGASDSSAPATASDGAFSPPPNDDTAN